MLADKEPVDASPDKTRLLKQISPLPSILRVTKVPFPAGISEPEKEKPKTLMRVKMKGVYATFYFKDNTVLRISSDLGDYNNKTLDIIFRKNVRAMYENSELFAEKAEFSNSGNYLKVSENVKIIDAKGTMFADKLVFDIKSKSLNVTSLNDNIVKSKVRYK